MIAEVDGRLLHGLRKRAAMEHLSTEGTWIVEAVSLDGGAAQAILAQRLACLVQGGPAGDMGCQRSSSRALGVVEKTASGQRRSGPVLLSFQGERRQRG